MDNKTKISHRITTARKQLGITIKELALRTEVLSPARIGNWEQGTRNPGPDEAKIMSKVLGVSASYLLGLTDNQHGELLFPNKSLQKALNVYNLEDITSEKLTVTPSQLSDEVIFSDKYSSSASYAAKITDNSMAPDFNLHDIIIANNQTQPKPGDFVLAYLPAKKQTILRKYAEMDSGLFQLLASNSLWAAINVTVANEVSIIGVVVEHRRYF